MAESSRGAAELPQSGADPISSSAAAGKGGANPRPLGERFKSLRRKITNPASLKTLSTSGFNASLRIEKGGDNKRSGDDPVSTDLGSGKKPEASSAARSGPSTAQSSHLSPSNGNASAGTGKIDEAAPIAELWNRAYEELREKEPKLIKKYEEEISLQVSAMVDATVAISGLGKVRRREQMEVLVKQKLKEDEDGKWRIRLGDDRIAIRDLARYVVSIVDWGKDFVGAALESSPYGSIAWTGVCLLLPLLLGPSKQRASNICGLEYIADLLSRCTMYEYAYHQRYEMNHDGLRDNKLYLASDGYKSALKELYLRVLRFQARSVCQLSRNPVSGGIHAMFKMDDWDALLEDIKLQETNCQTFFDSVKDQEALDAREEGHKQRISLLLDKLEQLNFGIERVRDKLEEIHISEDESKCFEALRTSNYLARKNLNPERLAGTCKWFFDHPKYQGWMAQTPTSRLLWVSADPGCGKSVLAKALVDQYGPGNVCYYFFKDDTTITRSAAHALCAILHQICDLQPAFIKHVLPMYKKNGVKLVNSFEDLCSVFFKIISDKDFGNVICILDAIDECSEDDQKKLLQRLAAVATLSTSIKILITSRPYKSIETALFHNPRLDKNEIRLSGEAEAEQSMIEKEIGLFITFRVQEFRKLREFNDIYDNAHEKLQSHLDDVKNRTYLWVSAVFNELERDIDAPEYIIAKTIQTLPDNVDKAYENILEKSSKSRKTILIRVLHIMLAAFRPLSLMEMSEVLSIQDSSSGLSDLYPEQSFGKWIRDLCGFFVNVVDDRLHFAHQTAREFLIGENGCQPAVGWKSSFQLIDSHILLACFCIDYLRLLYDESVDAKFQAYATSYWPRHCQNFEENQSLADKVENFFFQNGSVAPSFDRWTMTIDNFPEHVTDQALDYQALSFLESYLTPPPPTPLFLACNFGWLFILSVLKTFPAIDWNGQNKYGCTGLYMAAQEGHLEIVKLLLDAGADVNIPSHSGQTPLYQASGRGYLEIMKLLLNAGADIEVGGILYQAVENEHLETVEFLLTAGADVNSEDYFGGTALHFATSKGNLKIVKLLLDAKADVNIRPLFGETALSWAASQGHLEILKLLLNAGADINILGSNRQTALHFASSKGNLEIVKLLLDAKADVDIQECYGETALCLAASQGNLEIVNLLLTAGANVNSKDYSGGTVLHFASSKGNLEIVKLLLDAKADVDIQNRLGETALYLAASQGNLEIVKLLLDAKADVDIQQCDGETALYLTASQGHLEIVKLLLNAGADINIQGSNGQTALHFATSKGNLETVKLLLDAKADVNIQPLFGETALSLAASQGPLEILKLLLNAGADINILESNRQTALHFASSKGNLEIVKLLLDAKADVDIQNRLGETALYLAASKGNLEIVKLLLDAKADVDIQECYGETALYLAASQGNLEIVKLLLTAGANVNAGVSAGDHSRTALHMARLYDHVEIVKTLLAAGAVDS